MGLHQKKETRGKGNEKGLSTRPWVRFGKKKGEKRGEEIVARRRVDVEGGGGGGGGGGSGGGVPMIYFLEFGVREKAEAHQNRGNIQNEKTRTQTGGEATFFYLGPKDKERKGVPQTPSWKVTTDIERPRIVKVCERRSMGKKATPKSGQEKLGMG